jgi:hypothetical protein
LDILPGSAFDTLINCGLQLKRRTYAAAARAMSEAIKEILAISQREAHRETERSNLFRAAFGPLFLAALFIFALSTIGFLAESRCGPTLGYHAG